MTTELMTTPITYNGGHTLSYPQSVTTSFLKNSEVDLQTHANSGVLVPERTGVTDSKAPITERRLHGNRITTDVDVTLFKRGEYQGKGTIGNVSLRGLWVETAVEFDKNSVVQLRLSLPDEHDSVENYRLWGTVVHSSDKGIGLHVDILHPASDAGLQAVITCARS